MKKILLSLALICAVVLSANAENQLKKYYFKDFTGINADNAFQVTVEQSERYSVRVEVQPEYEQYLDVKVKQGILYLGFSDNLPKKMKTRSSKVVSAKVSMPVITSIALSGSSDMKFKDPFEVAMGEVFVYASGSSTIKDFEITAPEVEIRVSGSSHVEMKVESSEVDVEISGASKVVLAGRTSEMDAEISGASGLVAKSLEVQDADVEASGASKAQVNATFELKVSLSGASTCIYEDNSNLKVNARKVAGASTLKTAK